MRYVIHNTIEEIYSLESLILERVEEAGFDENSRFAIRLALDEALVNAFKHGNHEDPEKNIKVELQFKDNMVTFTIEDDGEGFDQSVLLDPRRGECLKRTNGRGIFLIKQFMSHTEFNKKGNRISFVFEKRNDLGIDEHGLTHWRCDPAEVLELDPIRVERSPSIVYESIMNLVSKGIFKIIVDLKFLEQIDSSVLGYLVGATREIESRGGKLVLVRAQPEVARVIRVTGLDIILNVQHDLKSGLSQFADN